MEDNKLVDFFNKLDRSFFLDNANKDSAATDAPLPIGFGQTISQPSLVLEMTRRLDLDKDSKVLEIGTGSGYQTTFLAEFAGEVFTIERIPTLSKQAKEKLDALGYNNIRYKIGDGSLGWSSNAPFNRIITTAAAENLPDELIKQLKAGGRMIAPVGPKGSQDLLMITKDNAGRVAISSMGKVVFVEMVGKYGWNNGQLIP